VGGHCIGVDPYYLIHKSMALGFDPQVINSGRRINDLMPAFIAKKLTQLLISKGKYPQHTRVLVMGITFKENVSDIRNSKVADLITELNLFAIRTDIHDPHASAEEVKKEYGFDLVSEPGEQYDAIVVAVNHDDFKRYSIADLKAMMNGDPILVDIKALYDRATVEKEMTYWRL
ncbi:MAG: nucleotide sugar dehydrogenase, partial [Saprospiraceae bacterium]|nr:nucleotide sugar dehydrogenase [Saprospiraceae bacterium]